MGDRYIHRMSVAGCKFTSVYYLSHHNRTFTIKFTEQQVTPSPLYYILSVCMYVCLSVYLQNLLHKVWMDFIQ